MVKPMFDEENAQRFDPNPWRKFYVKDVPADWDEWRLFSAFYQLGLVDNVAMGTTVRNGVQNAFVTMLRLEDGDKIRNELRNKRQLTIDNTTLIVEPFLGKDQLHEKENNNNSNNDEAIKAPRKFCELKEKKGSPLPANQNRNKPIPVSSTITATKTTVARHPTTRTEPYRIIHGDLPLLKPQVIEIVEAPRNFLDDDRKLTFFCRIKDFENECYANMQRAINVHASSRLPDDIGPEVNDCCIVTLNSIAYRARIIQKGDYLYGYLVDFGKTVIVMNTWLINNSMYQRSLNFHLPQTVIQCQFADVLFNDQNSVDIVRKRLNEMKRSSTLKLVCTTKGYQGSVNLVKLVVTDTDKRSDDFLSWVAKNDNISFTRTAKNDESLVYTRNQLMEYQKVPSITEMSQSLNEALFNQGKLFIVSPKK
ncbi:unnamed protein product, partial [Mesorhabditis belari]|uniref:Tudor domain-containing protein n=1 Tax=Mesorhabditis belari TaxID=2138241 RepID=A0AAF3F3T0_9BILA